MLMALVSFLVLIAWVYLAAFQGQFWKPLLDVPANDPKSWPSVDIIVPARDEAEMVTWTIPALLEQDYPGDWRVILVDDHSVDGTGALARKLALESGRSDKLTVVEAPELSEGWSGKVAAMQAGVNQGQSDFILFTDSDILHPVTSLRNLMARALASKLDLASLMVKLHCERPSEHLLIPAFVFFFAMLYPFRRVNDDKSRVAGAAGGVMLVKRKALSNIGGLESIKSALIDDCSLAHRIKDHGGSDSMPGKINLTLTNDVHSLRVYPTVKDIKDMISRTAFTQLRYSFFRLLGTVIGLGLLFIWPFLAIAAGDTGSIVAGLASWLIMTGLYWPTIQFYGLPWIWAFTLPWAAIIYMEATIDSARQYWQGKGGQWKGRAQAP